ncbi:MAG: ABC transporter permease [bacterium]|nr:ABC transporter permease [bacterium]
MGDPSEPDTPAPDDVVVAAAEAAQTLEEGGSAPAKHGAGLFTLRRVLPQWQAAAIGCLSILVLLGLWYLATAGEAESRMISPTLLSSPGETFDSFHELWFDRALTRNTFVTLRRVLLGFLLACLVGIPLGVLSGCFGPVRAFFTPLTIFGRNIPIAALIPLTFTFFGIGEMQKVMFIFIACVMFILGDTATAVRDVSQRYVDTAYTLGAGRRQTILKVLVPLAMPSVFNSLRLLFGLAFGYIMLAEVIKFGSEAGGLGDIINQSQRRGPREHILLILILIPVLAFLIDKGLQWIQRGLFPHRYGGSGLLNRGVRWGIHRWEDLKASMWQRDKLKKADGPGGGDA